jgi:methylisocitrate lyase
MSWRQSCGLATRCSSRGLNSICARTTKTAADARADESFVLMARTDAVAPEGLESAITRCQAYLEAGADMIFCEALTSLDDYRSFTQALTVPVLANGLIYTRNARGDVACLDVR